MATDNRTLLQKVDLTLAQIATGGLLQTQQTDEFILLAINEPVMTREVFVTGMTGPVEERDKMRFAGRVLRAGTEAQALAVAERSAPAFTQYLLTSRLYRAEVRITDEAAEDQIERGTFRNTVMSELTKAIGRDSEHVAINGDVTTVIVSPDTALLATQDGWIRRANANLVDANNAQLNPNLLRDALTTMPVEFRRNRATMRYYTSDFAEIRYNDDVRGRQTVTGDRALEGDWSTNYMRIPLRGVPEFPVDLGVGANETVVLLSDPKNFALGFQRKVRVETDRDGSAGATLIIASIRMAVAVVEPQAAVRVDEVRSVA